jgi:hypothetical protein
MIIIIIIIIVTLLLLLLPTTMVDNWLLIPWRGQGRLKGFDLTSGSRFAATLASLNTLVYDCKPHF